MPELPRNLPLFRPAAARPGHAFAGATLLPAPRGMRPLMALAAVALAALGALLALGEFTQRAHATGWIAPAGGVARIAAPRAGVLSALPVSEGQRVVAGQALLTLANVRSSSASADAGLGVLAALQRERSERQAQLAAEQDLHGAAESRARHELLAAADRRRRLELRVGLLRERLELARADATRSRELAGRGLVPRAAADRGEDLRLDAEQALQAVDQERAGAEAALAAARLDAAGLPARAAQALAGLRAELAALDLRIAEAQASLDVVVRSPVAGRVAGLALSLGQSVTAGTLLVMVVPDDAPPRAQLWLPARAAASVEAGAAVRLRVRAADRRAHTLVGTVLRVGHAALAPADQHGPVTAREPAHLVDVSLEAAPAIAAALRPGALVDAGIVRERRRLASWVLDPLRRSAP